MPGRILVAPDSFKGSLTAAGAATAMASGVRRALPRSVLTLRPVSDGGEGFIDALLPHLGGTLEECEVQGPLPGRRVSARWALVRGGTTALIEMAAASGLMLIPAAERDPRITTTYGVGELMRAAMDRGARVLLIGIGGSGTNDGGAGMASALGVRFLDAGGRALRPGGAALADLAHIDPGGLDARLAETEVTVACDVNNPLTGPRGASAVFAPQKGGGAGAVALLEGALRHYADLLRAECAKDVESIPGSGAAGGLGAGLIAFCGARPVPGIDLVLDLTRFDDALASSDMVLTGEGRLDAQTPGGKALSGILSRARARGVPVVAVAGSIEGEESLYTGEGGFAAVASLAEGGVTHEAAMRDAARLLEERTYALFASLKPGVL